MDLREALTQTADALRDRPKRALASSVSVFAGSAAIVVMLAWGTGFREFMRAQLESFGERIVLLYPSQTSSGFAAYRKGVPVQIGRADVELTERLQAQAVQALVAEHLSEGRLLVEARTGRVRRLDVSAADERYGRLRRIDVEHGRFFDAEDVRRGRSVAVLGHDAAADFFGDAAAAIGQVLRIEGASFEVIGVARSKARQYLDTTRPDNRLVIVPTTAAEWKLGFDEEAVTRVILLPQPAVSPKDAIAAVARTLGPLSRFHPDDVDALRRRDLASLLAVVDLFYAGFMIFVGVAGCLTMVVGGIGIANYQLACLAERTVEIAVAKAIGARNRTLMLQSALDGLVLGAGAGVAGVAVGLLACAGLTRLAVGGALPEPRLSLAVVVVTLFAMGLVSTVAAVIPALRVRSMEIAPALRATQ